jgi:hypothetical protein
MAIASVDFDGSNDYATGGAILSYEYTNAFSFALWMKVNSFSDYVLTKRGGSSTFRGYSIFVDSSRKLEFCLCNDFGSGAEIRVNSLQDIGTVSWRHVVFSYSGNGLASGLLMVIDGVSEAFNVQLDALAAGTIITTAQFNLSGRTNGGAAEFNGRLHQVGAYNKALSLVEAQEIYNGGVPVDLTTLSTSGNLTNWWKMGDGDTFPTLLDSAGSNNLTMTNMLAADIVFDGPFINVPRLPILNNDIAGDSTVTTYYQRAWNLNTLSFEYWQSTGSPDLANPPSGDPISGATVLNSVTV